MKATTVKKTQYRQAGNSLGTQPANESAPKDVASPTTERTGYHQNASTERKCDSCKYKTPATQCQTFRCKDCGTYLVSQSPALSNLQICDYCYEDYMEKGGYYDSDQATKDKKISCVYCWSRQTLTDV